MPNQPYEPVANDNLTMAFDAARLIPDRFRGSDAFLDLVTWNIRYFHDRDPERVERIAQILAVLNADVIVLEEIANGAMDMVAERLDELGAGYYDTAYGTTGGQQRVAIMWDLDWIRAKDDIRELFGKNAVIADNGKDAFPRLPLWAYFTVLPVHEPDPPFDFQLLGLHLKSQRGGGGEQRRKAAETLAAWLVGEGSTIDADIVMAGDWNEPPDADAWAVLRELESQGDALFAGLNDTRTISHLYYKNKRHIGSRLDLVAISSGAEDNMAAPPETAQWTSLTNLLASNPKAKQIKDYIRDISKGISDHMPVVSRFYLTETT